MRVNCGLILVLFLNLVFLRYMCRLFSKIHGYEQHSGKFRCYFLAPRDTGQAVLGRMNVNMHVTEVKLSVGLCVCLGEIF